MLVVYCLRGVLKSIAMTVVSGQVESVCNTWLGNAGAEILAA